jgi:hypothetical protein
VSPIAVEEPRTRAEQLLELITAGWQTQAIGVAADLGLPDAMASGPATSADLAERLCLDADALDRLLRALVSLEVCHLQPDNCYALAPLGTLLRSDAPGSLRAWATWWSRYLWPLWGDLRRTIESGQSARVRTGSAGFAYIEEDANAARLFNAAMGELTSIVADVFVRQVEFPATGVVVDLGGGHGELLITVMRDRPALRGILFELPHALEGARAKLREAWLSTRVEVLAGDFFESVPRGADVYLLKSVLHNWDESHCIRLLERCRSSMSDKARLWVIERVRPERAGASEANRVIARNDLNMLIGVGGRERTEDQLTSLFSAAQLQQLRSAPLTLGLHALELKAKA